MEFRGEMKRTDYLDYLRIIAILATIMIHVSAQNWRLVDVNTLEWNVFNFYDSMVR